MKVFTTALFAAIVAAQENYPGCEDPRNESSVLDLVPEVIGTTTNGQAWKMAQDTNVVWIARVQGTPYEMGYAQGELLSHQIAGNLQNMIEYGRQGVTDFLDNFDVPKLVSIALYEKALLPLAFWLLDLNWKIALPYIPQRYIDEMQGISDGSAGKVDYDLLRRINMIPELTQAACTVLGAWGPATENNTLLHLRALDWDSNATISQYPSVIIYEPTEEGSNTFANIGFAGLIGVLTAMSKNGISAGEKVYYDISGAGAKKTYRGKPWMWMLRDTVQFSKNLADVEKSLTETKRTMMIHNGWGSLPDNSFRGADIAANFVKFYDDKTWIAPFTSAHPQMDGVFYYDKLLQPSDNACVGSVLEANYGKITPEVMYSDVAGRHRTGDTQMVVMDPAGQQIWASWAEYKTGVHAHLRSPIHIRLSDFWSTSEQQFLQ